MNVAGVDYPHKQQVDHIHHNALNNTKNNLRMATNAQNVQNSAGKQSNNTSGYIGVCWHKCCQKWQARINKGGKRITIGLFTCKIEAAKARDKMAIKHYGEFANLNILKIIK